MNFQTTETIQRLWETFLQEQLANMPPKERDTLSSQFEQRFGELMGKSGSDGNSDAGFFDLLGLGPNGAVGFDKVGYPAIHPTSTTPSCPASCMPRPSCTTCTSTSA